MAIGNTKLDQLLRRSRILDERLAWLTFFDTKTKQEIISWVQNRLRTEGTNKKGEVIGYYSLATELISGGRKQFNTHYTLFDEGDFYASMFVMVFIDEFVIDADSDKGEEDLFEKYGTGIIGLTDEEINRLVEKLKIHYREYIRQTLQIN